METPRDPDLVKVTEIYLIPSSFLVAALGTVNSNPHRAVVSVLGLLISVLWWQCAHDARQAHQAASSQLPRRTALLHTLAVVFMFGWLFSAVVHGILWNRPLWL